MKTEGVGAFLRIGVLWALTQSVATAQPAVPKRPLVQEPAKQSVAPSPEPKDALNK